MVMTPIAQRLQIQHKGNDARNIETLQLASLKIQTHVSFIQTATKFLIGADLDDFKVTGFLPLLFF